MSQDKKELDVLYLKDYSPVKECFLMREDPSAPEPSDQDNGGTDDKTELFQRAQKALSDGMHHVICPDGMRKEEGAPSVFTWFNNEYWTGKYVGVLYFDDSTHSGKQYKIQIGSRFDGKDQQYFLSYMFARAFGVNGKIFEDMDLLSDPKLCWDLPLIVQYFLLLRKALHAGFYKEYVTYHCNDSKLNGPVDVPRHTRENMLFRGTVAYTRRENTTDNDINRLILVTYRYIRQRYPRLIKAFAEDGLERKLRDLQNLAAWNGLPGAADLIYRTRKPVTRHLFTSYEALRKLCHLLLHHMGVDIMDTKQTKISGLLIDISKLWEDFLHVVLLEPQHFKTQEEFRILYKEKNNGARSIIPDFVHYKQGAEARKVDILLDAKYKPRWAKDIGSEELRGDIYQVMAYMLALDCRIGGVLYPYQEREDRKEHKQSCYTISKFCDRSFYTFPVAIPEITPEKTFVEFRDEIEQNIKVLLEEQRKIFREQLESV